MMKIKTIIVGDLETNCYILQIDNQVLIIDPGDEKEKIIDTVADQNCLGILLTHHHFDHVGGLEDIQRFYGVPVYDKNNLKEQHYQIGSFSFDVIFTPGHTSDSVSYYFKDDNILFSGDFIFKGCIGRTDLGGNDLDMLNSIKKIKKYNKRIIIKPGHGEDTTLDNEIKYNPFFH